MAHHSDYVEAEDAEIIGVRVSTESFTDGDGVEDESCHGLRTFTGKQRQHRGVIRLQRLELLWANGGDRPVANPVTDRSEVDTVADMEGLPRIELGPENKSQAQRLVELIPDRALFRSSDGDKTWISRAKSEEILS